jgi:putative tryptophan/tyrosine transport system substrate-binding protein
MNRPPSPLTMLFSRHTKRRDFIAGLGSAAGWPLAGRAQQGEPVRRIAALIGVDESQVSRQTWVAEFRKRLHELGWIEGRNLQINWRWAAGDRDRARRYASELVALRPDVLFGDNTFVVAALLEATRILPIVFALVNNPIGSGFVRSLAHPGGNVTGFADSEPLSLVKLGEFVKQVAPHVERVVILGQFYEALGESRLRLVETSAASLGLKSVIAEVHDTRGLEDVVAAFAQDPNGVLIIPGDPFTAIHGKLILTLALHYELPTISGYRDFTSDGGLLSYGTKAVDQYRGAADYVGRIFKGARPDELPVQQPTRFELIINLKTAKALGLTVPPTLLALADEVIE